MRTAKLLVLLTLSGVLLLAGNGRGTISGNVANPDGVVRIDATSLNTGERFSVAADANGGFTLASLPAGEYRVVFHNAAGTASARRLLKVRAGETPRLDAKLEAMRLPRIDGRRTAVRKAAAATADLPPLIQQFRESSRDLKAVVLVDDNHGWAVGDTHWDQTTRQFKGSILNTTDGGVTWTHQDPGVAVSLNGLFFLNASQGWVVGDNGTILRTTDGGAHWTQQPVASADSFVSVSFTDALNGWAASNTPIQWGGYPPGFVNWQAGIWHSTDGGQTWARQTIPASASILKRIVFVNATTGFAAGAKRTGYDSANNPIDLGAIYGTTDGGRTWNEIYTTSQGLTFTSLCFTDASNGWAAGFALSSDYTGGVGFHTADGGKTWQPQNLNSGDPFLTQVRDLRMLDSMRGYAIGTAYLGDGTAVWRTLDGGATWTGVKMENTDPLAPYGYWGMALTADRVLIVGDRDTSASSSEPWNACSALYSDCREIFTQANISPHYIFEDVYFADRNHGWAAGTRTFSSQVWGQEIFATEDGGQTWTTQFERAIGAVGHFSYLRLDSISFADANNGWAAGSSELFPTSSGYDAQLGCILHTSDGGKTWTDQAGNICGFSTSTYHWNPTEYSVIQALDAQNVWALAADADAATVQVAHSTNGGSTWTLVDTGIAGSIAVGYGMVQGGMHFIDAQHGCFGGWDVAGCTSDGGAHWTQSPDHCKESPCYLNSNGVAFADSLHGWIVGGGMYTTTDGGADWTPNTPVTISGGSNEPPTLEAIQFVNSSNGWLSGDRGLLFQTTDAGADWHPVSSGTSNDLLGLSFVDPTHGWIVGDYGTILSYAGDRTPAGAPAVFAAVNAASYTAQTAPAAWISIFGANLSATTRAWAASDFVNGKLPTKLDGVSVLVNGNPAYLSYISPRQINAMFQDDGSTGQVSVQVTNSAGSSGTLAVQKAAYSPSLFRLSVEQGNYVIAQTTDGMLVGNYIIGSDLGMFSQVRNAIPGEIVTLYGTGFGPTNPALPSDAAVTGSAQTASPVTFTVGGIAAVVQWAGMIGPGLYQFNIYIPPNAPTGDLVIVSEVAGYFSQGDSVISVRAD
jgi:uncharacterized protein (TIGR03437 family)